MYAWIASGNVDWLDVHKNPLSHPVAPVFCTLMGTSPITRVSQAMLSTGKDGMLSTPLDIH